MANYFETKVRFEKRMENGAVKKVAEPYLVDALSFTEAEAKITKAVRPYISGDFTVEAVKKTKIVDIFKSSGGGYWYLVKVAFISVDEKTGEDKKTVSQYYVQSNDFEGAVENFNESMEGTMGDWEIVSVTQTQILDVYQSK